MKICVFSDSHGCAANLLAAVGREAPAFCFFLGDGERDLAALRERFPALPVEAVRGNCDLRSALPLTLSCAVGGVRLFAAHGHTLNVKYEPELDTLRGAARRAGASLALFGHTHRAYLAEREGLTLLNPGAIGRGAAPRYAVLTVEDGRFSAELKTL